MKVSSIHVISVILNLHNRVTFRVTYQQSTVTQLSCVTTVTIRWNEIDNDSEKPETFHTKFYRVQVLHMYKFLILCMKLAV